MMYLIICAALGGLVVFGLIMSRGPGSSSSTLSDLPKEGTATTDVDGAGGQFQMEDSYLFCVSASGDIIRKGSRVTVKHYDRGSLTYQVEPVKNEA